jgi:ABC-type nitrate/sulfonate/bicarbonate transport system substrate-binding protein
MRGRSARGLVTGVALLLLTAAAPAIIGSSASAAEKVTVRFTWKYKGEYAPLFVALDKGYYKAQGLDVVLAEGSGSSTVLTLVANGDEQVGYGPADNVASGVNAGMPVQVVAAYQTELPSAVIAFPDVPLASPKDLEGKTIALPKGDAFARLLPVFAKLNGVDIKKIKTVQLDSGAAQTQFLNRGVELTSLYMSNGLPRLEKISGVKFNRLPIAAHGMRLLGASFFVNTGWAERNSVMLTKLIAATNMGYEDATANPQQAAEITAKYLPPGEDMDVLLEQIKETLRTTNAPDGKPIGWQTDVEWQQTLDVLKESGQIDTIKPLNMYFTNKYMPAS